MTKPIETLSTEHFEALLDRYGTDLQSWPDTECEAAQSLLETSEDARNSLALALSLEHMREEQPALKAPKSLVDRIMKKARDSD